MHVSFVAGVGSTNPNCVNSSGVSAQFASDPTLSAALSATTAAQSISSASATSSSTSALATSSKSAGFQVFKVAPLSDFLLPAGLILVFIALWVYEDERP